MISPRDVSSFWSRVSRNQLFERVSISSAAWGDLLFPFFFLILIYFILIYFIFHSVFFLFFLFSFSFLPFLPWLRLAALPHPSGGQGRRGSVSIPFLHCWLVRSWTDCIVFGVGPTMLCAFRASETRRKLFPPIRPVHIAIHDQKDSGCCCCSDQRKREGRDRECEPVGQQQRYREL